jgi:hypothetical protein
MPARLKTLLASLFLASFSVGHPGVFRAQVASQPPAVRSAEGKLQILPLAPPAAFKAHLRIGWRGGRLTLSAERVPLATILVAVMRRTGLEVQGLENVQGEVSVELAGVTLKEGLESLLAHTDYVLQDFTGPSGSARVRVLILDRQNSPGGQELVATHTPIQPSNIQGLKLEAMKADQANLEELRKALQDSDPAVRAAALEALSQEDAQTAAKMLSELPGAKQGGVDRLQALQRLVQNGQSDGAAVLSSLADALRDKDPAVRAFAIQNLAGRGGAEAMGYLRDAFHDLDPANRMLALESVVQRDGGQQLLEDAMQDPDDSVRSTAAELLKQFGPPPNGENNPDAKYENDADAK